MEEMNVGTIREMSQTSLNKDLTMDFLDGCESP